MTLSPTRRVLAGILALGMFTACTNRGSAPTTQPPVPASVSPVELSWEQPSPLPLQEPAVRFLRSRLNTERLALVCRDDVVLRTSPGWYHATTSQTTSTGVRVSQDSLEATLPAGDLLHQLEVRNSETTRFLSVQCLPADFPTVTVTGMFSSPVLLTAGPSSLSTGFRLLLDRDGFPLWFEQTVPVFGDLAFHGDGVVRHSGTTRPVVTHTNVPGQGFELVARDGRVMRSWIPNDDVGLDFHAGQALPNGNLLAIRYLPGQAPQARTAVSGVDQQEYTCPTQAMANFEGALYGQVVEITPQGVVARSWSLAGSLPDAAVSAEAVFVGRAGDGQPRCLVDLHHLNGAVFYQTPGSAPGHGRVLVTGRHINGAVLLDWPSGQVIWTIGGHSGPHALTVTSDPLGGPFRPHDANLVTGLDGDRLLLYDNRDIGQPSRAVVYRIDPVASTATLEATYTADCGATLTKPQSRTETTKGSCAAFVMGSARALPDDRGLLVGWGAAAVTASEFAWGDTSPRAQVSLGGLWSYRVVPVTESDVDRFLGR